MLEIPFAGFKDFQDCVNKQMARHRDEKGFKVENARRICGAIQARVEGTKKMSVVHHGEHATMEV